MKIIFPAQVYFSQMSRNSKECTQEETHARERSQSKESSHNKLQLKSLANFTELQSMETHCQGLGKNLGPGGSRSLTQKPESSLTQLVQGFVNYEVQYK